MSAGADDALSGTTSQGWSGVELPAHDERVVEAGVGVLEIRTLAVLVSGNPAGSRVDESTAERGKYQAKCAPVLCLCADRT